MTISHGDVSGSRPLTIASLVQRSVPLEWQDAVAIVLEIAGIVEGLGLTHVPTYGDLELTQDGTISVLREPARAGDPVDTLLRIFRAVLPTESPAHLWTLLPTSSPDSPTYDSVADFAAALRYFEHGDRRKILSDIYQRAVDTQPSPQSDDAQPESEIRALPYELLKIADIHVPEYLASVVPESLVEWMREHGPLQPVVVRRRGAGYELVIGSRTVAAAKEAGLTRLPCQIAELDDDAARVLAVLDAPPSQRPDASAASEPDWSMVLGPALGAIADSLGAARSCWGLSSEGTARPYHRTVSQVTQVELQRATWLVEALRVLGDRPVLQKTTQNLGSLLDRVFRATRAERRLADTRLLANLSEASVVFSVDEALVTMAYGGILQAMLALVGDAAHAVVRCEVRLRESGAVVEFSQDCSEVSHQLLGRFFDESYHGRPGGYGAAVALSAARRVIELHGGESTVQLIEPRGCGVTTSVPL